MRTLVAWLVVLGLVGFHDRLRRRPSSAQDAGPGSNGRSRGCWGSRRSRALNSPLSRLSLPPSNRSLRGEQAAARWRATATRCRATAAGWRAAGPAPCR